MFKKIKNSLKNSIVSIVSFVFLIGVLLTIFLLVYFYGNDNLNNAAEIAIYALLAFAAIVLIVFIAVLTKHQKEKVKKINNSMNFYVENLISTLSIGIVIFQPNGKILWSSNFIEERFGKKINNESINFFNEEVDFDQKINDFTKIMQRDEYVYKLLFNAKEMLLIVKDITQEYAATHFYEIEKLVIGELEIDNYQLFRGSLSDEELFSIQLSVKELLDKLSSKYNLVHKQYMDGKFMILTNRENLNKMMINSFNEFDELDNKVKLGKVKVSLSVGFGTDSSNYETLVEMSKDALYQSQTRGGDQITVVSAIEKTKRFGSKSEISVVKSRTKIKNAANNFKIKLQDKKIKNVVIYGHKFADLDAIGASYALYEVCKAFDKKTIIQNVTFDDTAQKAIKKYIKNPDEIFVSKIKTKSLNKNDTIIVIVDCSEETRVENPGVFTNAKSENLFIFDHHRVSKLDEIVDNLNTYIETTASSASEIITELIQFNEFHKYLSPLGAQMLLNGIYLDTNQFKKSTSSRTFAAAALLEDWGANMQETLSIMKISSGTNEKIMKIVSESKEVKPGYWLSYTSDVVPIDVVSMAADEILKIEGRKAAFVVAQLPKKSQSDGTVYKLSARSMNVNVQLIAEAVGGGGHFNAAAAVSDSKTNESLESFVDNITQAIISTKE